MLLNFCISFAADYVFTEGDCLIAMGSTGAYSKAKTHFKLGSVTPF